MPALNASQLLIMLVFCLIVAGLVIPNVGGQTTYSVSITVTGIPSTLTTNIYVDGLFNMTMSGGQTQSFTLSIASNPHAITVDPIYVPNSLGANGTRYFVQNATWSFSSPGDHVFTYVAQYDLTVQTPYSSSTGQGWYNSGAAVQLTLKDGEVDVGQGTRHVFASWTGDASGSDLISNEIFMTGPKTAVANWTTQFFLTIVSDPPNITELKGSGWYDAGSQAGFSATGTVLASGNTRLKFDHWGGDYLGQSIAGQILMDRPKTVRANYFAQYLLVVQYAPASISSQYNESHAGWYDANSNVQVGPAPSTIDLSSVERLRFTGWADNGSSFSTPSYTVVMDQPRTITLSYVTQYYVDVHSSQGSVSGSGWYDRGSTAKIMIAVAPETWPFTYTLTGWRLDPSTGALTKSGGSWDLTVDRPYVVEAQWSLDFLPIIMIFGGGGLAIASLAVAIALAYRRGTLNRGGPVYQPSKPKRADTLAIATQVCGNCGNPVIKGAVFCEKCGAPMEPTRVPSLDDKVYDYVVKHEGVISLSTASADLGISGEELKEITERLKKQGRLA